MNKKYVSINQQLIAEDEASLPVSDLSIQRGFGIFDFLKTVNNKPIFLEDHFDRFYHSAAAMHLEIGLNRTELRDTIYALMDKNRIADSGLKFILTGGLSADGYTMGKPNLVIVQTPFEIDLKNFDVGIKLVTYDHQRQLPAIKTIDYLQAIRLQSFIQDSNANDVLYHHKGWLRECPRANFFMVKDRQVITPQTDILQGITRSKILGFALDGFHITEEDFTLEDLSTADEAFISSSTKNALPVLEINGNKVGNGQPGVVTRTINNRLLELIGGYKE